jgi:hypothetical protein
LRASPHAASVYAFGSALHYTDNRPSVRADELIAALQAEEFTNVSVSVIQPGIEDTFIAPTSGKATVAGFDLYTGSEGVKWNTGYMSQRFSLYDDLTVRENIRFFAGIYGLTNQAIKERRAANCLKRSSWCRLLMHGLHRFPLAGNRSSLFPSPFSTSQRLSFLTSQQVALIR